MKDMVLYGIAYFAAIGCAVMVSLFIAVLCKVLRGERKP